MQPRARDERSLGELFAELSQQTTALVRQEIALARTELGRTAVSVGKDVGFLAVGGAVAYAGLLALVAAAILALGAAIGHMWLAALIVAVIVMLIGYFLVRRGLDNLGKQSFAPTQTIDTLKQDATWAKEQTP